MAKKKKTKEDSIRAIEEIQRRHSAQSLRQAYKKAAQAPSVVSTGTDSLKTGDAPVRVTNDSGYGTYLEQPGYACPDCKGVAFHATSTLDTHKSLYHGPADQLFG